MHDYAGQQYIEDDVINDPFISNTEDPCGSEWMLQLAVDHVFQNHEHLVTDRSRIL